MKKLKWFLYKSLFNNNVGKFILNAKFKTRYRSAADYWEKRYQKEGTSGTGSYGTLAMYKAGVLNKFVVENNVTTVIEFGCGDGNQLQQFEFPSYIGLDVSLTAIEKCIDIFKNDSTKSFFIYDHRGFVDNLKTFKAGLALSLDVLYHLLEDDVFEVYMKHLFSSSTRFVIIYAWDIDGQKSQHVKYRKFTVWIEKNIQDFHLIQTIENKDPQPACDFFIYEMQKFTPEG
ncbi:MAG: hypothetical protein ABI863_18450 [Ginsengibacter sp.]